MQSHNQKKNIENNQTAPKIIIPSKHINKLNNKENDFVKENNLDEKKVKQEKKGFSHSENLKKNIENKLNEKKIYETFDFNQAKKKDLEEKLKNYTSNIKSLKMNNLGFSKSLILVNGLIRDLDEKIHKIRNFKPKRII